MKRLFENSHITNVTTTYIFLFVLFIILPVLPFFQGKVYNEYFIIIVGIWGIHTFFNLNKIRFDSIDILVLFYTLYEVAHFFVFSKGTFLATLVWQRLAFVLLFYIFKYKCNSGNRTLLKQFVTIMSLRVVFELSLALLQFFNIISARSTYFSIAGSFATPNFFAYILAIGLLILIWGWRIRLIKVKHPMKFLLFVIMLLSIVFLVYAKSRASLIGIGFSALFLLRQEIYLGIKKLRFKVLSFILLLFAIAFCANWFYHLKKDSADGRLLIAKITSQEIYNKPILGHGLFSFSKGYNMAKANYFKSGIRNLDEVKVGDFAYSALNDYMQILYETGIVGLVLLLIPLLFALFKSQKTKYSHLGTSILIFLLVTAMFSSMYRNNSLISIAIMAFLMVQEDIKPRRYNNLLAVYIQKILVTVASLGMLAIGILKVDARNKASFALKNKKTIKNIPFENWTKWSYISSNHGFSEFNLGKIAYYHYDKKSFGLLKMEASLEKNIEPKNIRSLAYCYLELGNYPRAKELFALNIGTQPFRFEPKMDLIAYYKKTNEKYLLCEKAQELVDFPEKIPSKEVLGYKNHCREIIEKEDCGKLMVQKLKR